MSQAEPIDAALVRRLIRAQFPRWADLPVEPVAFGGWDNRSFRLGERMVVRLPSDGIYAPQVEKEQHWLPLLAPMLPVAVPVPLAMGQPGEGFAWPWSVYAWLEGETADRSPIGDLRSFAASLAGFIKALQRIEPTGGPPPGPHNFGRGGPLSVYDAEARRAIALLGHRIDAEAATGALEAALAAVWHGPPVWLHGDLSPGNLLVRGGTLTAVIDFGCCAVGDPACDLAPAWTFFDADARAAFRAALAPDRDEWRRGRGWALWKALIVLAGMTRNKLPGFDPRFVLEQVLADHVRDR
ncbi:MAG: aminoglycoside phosphotransferase family protein [Pseudomonadota bacterium]|nr:aminoglycoside phosphotransferase family protein [Pseudomonadota bacterium]